MLAALRRAGAPYELSPGRLLRETLVTSGTMTNRVDRLDRARAGRAQPDPDDRRGVIVRLTPTGRQHRRRRVGRLLDRERDLLAELAARARPRRDAAPAAAPSAARAPFD